MLLESVRTALAFFAHPDDEALAAGGTIARLRRSGADVTVALPATGVLARQGRRPQRLRELARLRGDCVRALARLGVPRDSLIFGDFPDNAMDGRPLLELVHWVEEIMTRLRPQLVLTHHRFCTNVDHQRCHEAAVVVTRPAPGRRPHVLAGEVPSSTGYLRPTHWEPNVYVELRPEDLAAKMEAMACYRDETRKDPHPRSPEALRALAKVRGSEAGVLWAEAFMAHRLHA
jgi:LmbE family N-acetylglucosaminyl deacetylase